jgi:DNA-binding CsgD family transcriptional regulator
MSARAEAVHAEHRVRGAPATSPPMVASVPVVDVSRSGIRTRTNPWLPGGARTLVERRGESDVLERLVEAVRAGEGRALVIRGEPGVGKTVLLDRLVDRIYGVRVARAAGASSETELAFAGLHQLCAPLSGHLAGLPEPQRGALSTALGVGTGPTPDHFLVGLAVLGLLTEVASEQPLLCVVDDEQWLDPASAQALGFVARRLAADPVGLVVATRHGGDHLAGLPELEVEGLPDCEARTLLDSAFPGPLDERTRDLIVAETHGNPSALVELPRTLTPIALAGGFGLSGAAPVIRRIEDDLHGELASLPDQARRLLELAAAEPSGDPVLVRRAAARLGIPYQAAAPAVRAGLVKFGVQVQFRDPLVRSTTYRRASIQHRQQVHTALAEVTDRATNPDRCAWHRGQAVVGPDESVAAELERTAGRAQARGGLLAAAAFLERSVELTADPAHHVERVLAAAQTNLHAGAFGKALELLATAEAASCDEFVDARVDRLKGQVALASHLGREAPSLLLEAARRLERLDLDLARRTYVDACLAASSAGCLADAGDLVEVARAARALPPSRTPLRPTELILDGLALLVTEGPAAAAPTLRRAVAVFTAGDVSREDGLRWGRLAAIALWDVDAVRMITMRQVQLARAVGALEQLPVDLTGLAIDEARRGDLDATAALVAEIAAIAEVTGSRIAPYAAMYLTALRGHQAELASLVDAAVAEAAAVGQGAACTYAQWVTALLHNGHCRYAEALTAAARAALDAHPFISRWALPELVEAAARVGDIGAATHALARLSETTQAGGTEFGLGLEARSRALLSERGAAEVAYREAIARLSTGEAHPDLARSHLLYGEWLRRQSRRVDARRQLRIAHELFNAIGMTAFGERARRELLATGESVRKRGLETPVGLTSQESSIARLAADGQTNAEIGAELFLSARTIEWHLRKVFTKLGIGSRRELRHGLTAVGSAVRPH